MLTDTEAIEVEKQAWESFAIAHPHEAYATWPDRFWELFHRKCPLLSREQMEANLNATDRA